MCLDAVGFMFWLLRCCCDWVSSGSRLLSLCGNRLLYMGGSRLLCLGGSRLLHTQLVREKLCHIYHYCADIDVRDFHCMSILVKF